MRERSERGGNARWPHTFFLWRLLLLLLRTVEGVASCLSSDFGLASERESARPVSPDLLSINRGCSPFALARVGAPLSPVPERYFFWSNRPLGGVDTPFHTISLLWHRNFWRLVHGCIEASVWNEKLISQHYFFEIYKMCTLLHRSKKGNSWSFIIVSF